MLRDLVHLGFNQDLAGRQVFDGILPVVAGSRRTCINWQFAQAGRYSRQHEDHSYGDDQFPFSYPTLSDPISGRSGGILQRVHHLPDATTLVFQGLVFVVILFSESLYGRWKFFQEKSA